MLSPSRQSQPSQGQTLQRQKSVSVAQWLREKKLEEYAEAIIAAGYKQVPWLMDEEAAAIQTLAIQVGMPPPAQKSFLKLWKEQQNLVGEMAKAKHAAKIAEVNL